MYVLCMYFVCSLYVLLESTYKVHRYVCTFENYIQSTYKVHTKYIHVFFKILQKQIVFSSFLFGTYIHIFSSNKMVDCRFFQLLCNGTLQSLLWHAPFGSCHAQAVNLVQTNIFKQIISLHQVVQNRCQSSHLRQLVQMNHLVLSRLIYQIDNRKCPQPRYIWLIISLLNTLAIINLAPKIPQAKGSTTCRQKS